jgi:hypothetical protein
MKCELELVRIWNIFLVNTNNCVLINQPTRTTSKHFTWNHKTNPSGHLICSTCMWYVINLRTALFWVITQWIVVISSRRFGPTYKCQECCTETSVRNYHYTLRNNPEQRSCYLLPCVTWNHAYALLLYCDNSNILLGYKYDWMIEMIMTLHSTVCLNYSLKLCTLVRFNLSVNTVNPLKSIFILVNCNRPLHN